jgi:hypothetical protein
VVITLELMGKAELLNLRNQLEKMLINSEPKELIRQFLI